MRSGSDGGFAVRLSCRLLVCSTLLACLCFSALGQKPVQDAARGCVVEESRQAVEAIEQYWTSLKASSPAIDSAQEPLALDVHKCVAMALANNPRALAAQDSVDEAKARVGQARSRGLPQATARTAWVHTEYNTPETGGGILGLGNLLGAGGGLAPDEDIRTDRVNLSQVMYAGGQIRAAVRASSYLAESQEWRQAAQLDILTFETKQAYYDCLLASSLVRVADDSIRTFQRHLADAERMLNVGLMSAFEVLRAKTELSAREADAVSARNAERLAYANLRRLIGLPQDTAIRLNPQLEPLAPPEPVKDLVAQANERRPELLALRKAIEAADADLDRVKGQYKPRVAASAEWTNSEGGGLATPEGWTFTLGSEWDIFAGGRRRHERAEARAKRSNLQHQLQDVESLVELDVTQAHIQAENAAAQTHSARATVALALEGLRLAELRFREGAGAQGETLDAELALTKAETNLMRALRDYAVAIAALDRAVGGKRELSGDASLETGVGKVHSSTGS